MLQPRRYLAILAIGTAALLFGALFGALNLYKSNDEDVKNDQASIEDWIDEQLAGQLPVFRLPTASGSQHNSADWLGNIVLLNVWATWCEPCRQEVPLLVDLHEEYGPQGLKVVGIALDEAAAVEAFAEQYGINYLSLIATLDERRVLDRLGSSALGLPHTIVFDRDGQRVDFHLGLLTREAIDTVLHPLLNQE
ncbi:MAG: TlpA family protein disulfide reductase [Natronospirillum sp.]